LSKHKGALKNNIEAIEHFCGDKSTYSDFK